MLALVLRLELAGRVIALPVVTGLIAIIAVVIIAIIAVVTRQQLAFRAGDALAITVQPVIGRLRRHLGRHDDAVVMFCVLEIVFPEHQITRPDRIASQRHVFFGDVLGGAADFHIRSARLKAARQWALTLAAPATTAAAVLLLLLSLPHEAPTGD